VRRDKQKDMRVLFTSSGRRVELIEIFKKEGFYCLAADSDPTAPSLYISDKAFLVPRVIFDPEQYVKKIAEICRQERVAIIVPLIDPELPVLARFKDFFLENSVTALISNFESVDLANDKYRLYGFFKKIGLPAPLTWLLNKPNVMDIENLGELFPALLKPRYGSSGIGIFDCPSPEFLSSFFKANDYEDYIIQKKVSGEEITIDILGDGLGGVISAVQRKRLKVRGGEVERGITVKYPELFQDVAKLAKAFRPFGAINLQCFFNPETRMRYYTEINARFGGGYPLAYQAGANFPQYIRKLMEQESVKVVLGDDYQEGLIMSRYDKAIYLSKDKLI